MDPYGAPVPLASQRREPRYGWVRATFRYLLHDHDSGMLRALFIFVLGLFWVDTAAMASELLLNFTGIGVLLDLFLPEEIPPGILMGVFLILRWFYVRKRIKQYRY